MDCGELKRLSCRYLLVACCHGRKLERDSLYTILGATMSCEVSDNEVLCVACGVQDCWLCIADASLGR